MTETHGSQRVLHWNKDGDGYNRVISSEGGKSVLKPYFCSNFRKGFFLKTSDLDFKVTEIQTLLRFLAVTMV